MDRQAVLRLALVVALVVAACAVVFGGGGLVARLVGAPQPTPAIAPLRPAPPAVTGAPAVVAQQPEATPEVVAAALALHAAAREMAVAEGDALVAKLQAWEDSAGPLSYAQLKRNADRYAGQRVVFRGSVLEIQDDPAGGSVLRLGVSRRYGVWDDPIWIETIAAPDESIVQGSVVRAYGTMLGSETYESQAGWTITIPKMMAVAVVPDRTPRRLARR